MSGVAVHGESPADGDPRITLGLKAQQPRAARLAHLGLQGQGQTHRARHPVQRQPQFAAAYEFSVRTIQEWERGAKCPSGPARTLLRAIKGDPEGLRKALAAA